MEEKLLNVQEITKIFSLGSCEVFYYIYIGVHVCLLINKLWQKFELQNFDKHMKRLNCPSYYKQLAIKLVCLSDENEWKHIVEVYL